MSDMGHSAENDALPPCSDCVRYGFTAACPEAIAAGCPVLRARVFPPAEGDA